MYRTGLTLFFLFLLWSGIGPKDYLTWLLEVTPAVIAGAVIVTTRKRFPLTSLTYGLILIHSIILMIGGHYTYAEVPTFDLIKEWFGHERNNYDKLGHFAQGFTPAIAAREIIIRNAIVQSKGWLNFFVISICLAISAFYELIEWWVSLISGEAADAFLGTQGDVWDTQSDMAFALVGALLALATLSRLHDRQLIALQSNRR